ncbi:MAG: outer membrane beta-barrel protein, partial [Bacteroidota bacterium]
GAFELQEVPAGDYLLQVTFIGYEAYSRLIAVGTEVFEAGRIMMQPISQDLQEIVVEAERAPISMRGDTIQYNADAFQPPPNAPVEDLLRRLPGVEVDRNGTIRAQGKEVDKVLVDGKEFFGDDPKVATQNLPADIVDKVQVFDRKSEAAEFSGVDDGERSTTINLGLKEDKKKGYFGTVEAGYGTENRTQLKGNVNRFTPTSQLSFLGRFNNINEQGFTIMDYFDFMGGMGASLAGGSLVSPQDLGISFTGDTRSNGFVTTGVGGLNYNQDIGSDVELSLNYLYNQIDRSLDKRAERQQFSGTEDLFSSTEVEDREVANANHRLNAKLDWEVDSLQDLKFRFNAGFNDTDIEALTKRATRNAAADLATTIDRDYQVGEYRLDMSSSLIYRRKLGKPGRTFVADLGGGWQSGAGESDLNAVNFFADEATRDTLLQEQVTDNEQFNFRARLSYTEPLGNGQYLEGTYRHQNFDRNADKDFFDIVNEQRFRNTFLSNQFRNDYAFDRAGIAYQRNRKKSNLSLRLELQNSRLEGSLQTELAPIDRTFTNWLPSANWRYEFTNTKSLGLRYKTSVREPSIDQLQPILDNSDPLNTYTGNPNLRPAYAHELSIQSMLYDAFSFSSFFAFLNIRYTQDQITNATTIDEQFRQQIMPINVDNDLLISGNASYGQPLRFMKSRFNVRLNMNYNRAILFVNNAENQVNRWNGQLSLTLENRKKEVVDLIAGAEWGYSTTQYDLNKELDQAFGDQSYFLEVGWNISKRFRLSSVFDYAIFPQGPFDSAQALPIWEASVSWFLLENKKGELRLSAFDLLDRNQGVNRNASFNFIENEQITSLGRYFMVSFVYNLKGFGG